MHHKGIVTNKPLHTLWGEGVDFLCANFTLIFFHCSGISLGLPRSQLYEGWMKHIQSVQQDSSYLYSLRTTDSRISQKVLFFLTGFFCGERG